VILAHIMMMPVEEVLLPLATGTGAATVIWLAALLTGGIASIGVTGEGVEPLG
jgi:hypothetical protein